MFRNWRLLGVVVLVAVLASVDLLFSRGAFSGSIPQRAPKLVVLVVFDQLRGDYLERWRDLFCDGGFRRLQDEGAYFRNCHYPYGNTVTGPGHASMLTGCSPNRHGIVGNDWYERGVGQVYCVGSPRDEQIPPALTDVGKDGKRLGRVGGISPEHMTAPTLGDALKDATGSRGKVVALSFKDRSAALPGGKHPDACYWFDSGIGLFVTSTYYRGRLHPWVSEYNATRPADAFFGKPWTRLRTDINYDWFSGPDEVEGEGRGNNQGRTFPHDMTGGAKAPGKSYYEALYNTPFGNEVLLGLAKKAIDAEQLGAGPMPDLLSVSFSCNDPVGHTWGPDSHEVLDTTLRSDLLLRDLLNFLDDRVGRDNYVLALTADHGVCPLPEVSQSRGVEAARLGDGLLKGGAEAFLAEKYGTTGHAAKWIEGTAGGWITLNRKLIQEQRQDPAAVEEELARWLRRQPGVQAVYTNAQLSRDSMAYDAVGQRMRRSYYPPRSGDLAVVSKPYYLFVGPFTTGTTHGTPHSYDTHVPLLVYGPGVMGGPRDEAVTPQAIAAIFAHFLGIAPPAKAEAPVPETLF